MAVRSKVSEPLTAPGFPELKARNLNGLELNIPVDLCHRATVLVVALKRSHVPMVESWLPHLEQIAAEIAGTNFYELPTLPAMYAAVRGIIDNGIAQQHCDKKNSCEHTFTVYTNQALFMKNARIASGDTIHIFLLDSAGQVVYRATGPWSEQKGKVLKESILAIDSP